VDEPGHELPDKVVGGHQLQQVEGARDTRTDQAHVIVTMVVQLAAQK
jgi:hypothetical protein